MARPRGILSADDFRRELAEADEEMKACGSVDELRDVWRRRYGRLGHKALARLLVGISVDGVVNKRAKSLSK